MAIELTKEQEEVLLKIIQRELDAPVLIANAEVAKAYLAEAEARWMADREAAQMTANAALNAVNVAYAAEIEAKHKAVEDAKAAIDVATATSVLADKVG
jgi:hypothetical protein